MLLKFKYKDIEEFHDSFDSANRHMLWGDPESKEGVWFESGSYTIPLYNQKVSVYKWVEGNFFD